MTRCRAGLVFLAMLVLLGACAFGEDNSTNARGVPKALRVGLIPNVAPDKQRTRYQPFADYLERKLDVKVELFVASDYAGVVEALASKHIDVAYLGGLTYVQAEPQVQLTPMVTEIDRETGTKEYDSAIVVKNESPYRSVKEVLASRGSFAFGDVSSTSGSLYPRIMLVEAGAKCSKQEPAKCPPLSKASFTGGHDAVAQAVIAGGAAAGGLELRILHRLEREGTVPQGALRVIETRRVMGYPWVARTALGQGAIGEITTAYEQITDVKLLELMRAKGYTRVIAADYEHVRTQARELGLAVKK